MDKKGFSPVGILLMILVLTSIILIGLYIRHTRQNLDHKLDELPTTSELGPKEAVIYKDETGTLYKISLLAKTSTQKGLAEAINSYCRSKHGSQSVGATGLNDFFDNAKNTVTTTSASLFMTCYDKDSKEAPWSYFDRYIFIKQGSAWVFD